MNEARFWAKVQKTETCWLWTGAKTSGYGSIKQADRVSPKRAHRVAYELLVGPIPDGLTLDHLCRVRACVNPAHLEPVTNAENVLRGNGLSAMAARQVACVHGHPFDEANTYRWRGERKCRTCLLESRQRRKVKARDHMRAIRAARKLA